MHIDRLFLGFLTALLLGTQLLACSSVAVQDEVQLTPAADGHWNARYRLAHPATGITLVRTPNDARIRRWHAVSADFEIVQIDNKDTVRRKDGASFSVVDIAVPATYVSLPKDYAPFAPFSDGGLLIHSGRYQWCVITAVEVNGDCGGPWLMQITSPSDAHLIVNGEQHTRSTQLLDSDNGTYVYVGKAKPNQSRNFIGIVDPALPTPLAQLMTDLLPLLMEQYAQELPPLLRRPMLFMSYDPSFSDGRGHQGGTLPGQVFMHFYGPGWVEAETDGFTPEDTAWFFAHEVGHLFQHDVRGELDASWIHEGAAEAFAYLILRSSKTVSEEFLSMRRERAFDGCRDALQRGTLATAAARAQFSDYYECGLIMFLAIDNAIRTSSADRSDLFSFWKGLIADTDSVELWQSDNFLDNAQQVIGLSLTERLRSLIMEKQDDPAKALSLLGLM